MCLCKVERQREAPTPENGSAGRPVIQLAVIPMGGGELCDVRRRTSRMYRLAAGMTRSNRRAPLSAKNYVTQYGGGAPTFLNVCMYTFGSANGDSYKKKGPQPFVTHKISQVMGYPLIRLTRPHS